VNDLERLEQMLRRRFFASSAAPGASASAGQPDLAPLARLNAARQALAPPRGRFSDARIARGVMAFRMSGEKTAYPDLKYACYGIARPMDWTGRILLAEARQFDQLLAAVRAQESRPRQLAACCRGLQAAWQADIEQNGDLLKAAHMQAGIAKLRGFLNAMRGESPSA